MLDGFGVASFSGAYDDVSADVDSAISIKRGRNDYLSAMQAGDCTFELFSPTNPDLYNPNASATVSPIRAQTPGFAPMRPVRVQAIYNGVTYPIFFGYLRNLEWNSDTRRTTVHAVDLMLWLSRARPTFTNSDSAAAGVTNTATAVQYVLQKSNWTRSTLIDMDSAGGDAVSLFNASSTSNKTTLQIIEDLLTAERGYFVVEPDGTARYRSRSDRAKQYSIAAFTSEQTNIGSSIDLDKITNQITVTASGSSYPQTANNYPSQAQYGLAAGSGITSTYITTDAQASALASYLVSLYSVPRPPVSVTIDNDSPATLVRQLTLDIGNRVTVTPAVESSVAYLIFDKSKFGGTDGFGGSSTNDFIIEQVEWSIAPGGLYMQTSYLCSAMGAEAIVFDLSTFDNAYRYFTY
jgi:hypothetical protein